MRAVVVIASDDVAAARDDLARLEVLARQLAAKFAAGWVLDFADRIHESAQRIGEVAAVPRCTAPECNRPLPPQVGPGPRRRYCSGRCKKRAARAL